MSVKDMPEDMKPSDHQAAIGEAPEATIWHTIGKSVSALFLAAVFAGFGWASADALSLSGTLLPVVAGLAGLAGLAAGWRLWRWILEFVFHAAT